MKRLLATAAGIVMVAASAHSQAPFADVPRDHWAYEAVNTLSQRGLIIGYPDGTFGGKRAMTRYEFAVVIARMIPQLEEYIRTQVANSQPRLPDDLVRRGDLANYVTRSDFDALQRLVNEFRPELQALRVDVDRLSRDVADLRGRVATLEDEVGRVRISGEMNAFAKMSSTNRGTLSRGISMTDLNGRPLNGTTNLLEASQVVYDMDLGITARVSKDINAQALLNVGNYLGAYLGAPYFPGQTAPPFDRNIFPHGGNTRTSSNAEFSAYKAYIEAPVAFRPLGIVNIEAGKTGVQFTPYTLKLVDYDDYTNITKTDNGDVIFTGLKGKFRLGGVGITAYGGTHGTALLQGSNDSFGNMPTGSGFPVLWTGGNYSPSGAFSYDQAGNVILTVPESLYPDLPYLVAPATQSMGVHATLGTPFGGTLGLSYISAGINNAIVPTGVPGINPVDVGRASVYGANLALNLSRGIGLTAEYANSNLYARGGTSNPFSHRDSAFSRRLKEAYDARVTFGIRSLALSAGYKKIDPYFGAPGAWGAIGRWKNPTNIEGVVGTIGIPLTRGLAFSGTGESYHSIVAGTAMGGDPLREDTSTKIGRWTAGFKFDLTSANRVDLGVETVYTKPNLDLNPTRGRAQETFYNFGIGHTLTDNSSLKFLYQIIDYKDNGSGLLFGGNDARGSVAVGQFSVKF